MEYKQLTLDEAATEVIEKQTEMGGKGGLIALDSKGNVAMPFNTAGMYRGYITESGKIVVKIYTE
jgi:beta-aspartyl-peptidase (threonine type)